MRRETTSALGSKVAGLAVFVWMAVWFWRFREAYPFYFIWDMDLISTLDALLVQSGSLPDHVNHPGFGMYWLFAWTQRLAAALGHLSFLDLTDVRAAGNPMLGIAELTDFFRSHSPWVACTIAAALAMGLYRVAPVVLPALLPMVVAAVTVQSSLLYHSAMIRTELYSVLFWALAFGALAIAHRREAPGRWLFAAGVALGLSFLSKLQVFLLLFWLPLVFVFLGAQREGGASRRLLSTRPVDASRRGRDIALAGAYLLGAVALIGGGAVYEVSKALTTFVSSYRFNSAAVALLVVMALPLWRVLLRRERWVGLEALLLGFFAAFAFHFVLYESVGTGWDYFWTDVKMLFFRTNYQTVEGLGVLKSVARLWQELAFAPELYVANAVLAGIAIGLHKGRSRWALIGLELLVLAHVAVGARFILRDLVWKDLPLVVWNVILLYEIFAASRGQEGSSRRARLARAAAISFFVLQIFGQGAAAWKMDERLEAHYVQYGWDPARWLSHVYVGGQPRYEEVILDRLPPSSGELRREALVQALQWRRIRTALDHVFSNLAVNFRDVSLARPGAYLPHSDRRIEAVLPSANALGRAILVVPRAVDRESLRFERPDPKEYRRDFTENQSKLSRVVSTEAGPPLTLLPRPDLQVLVFLPEGIDLSEKTLVSAPEIIRVAEDSGSLAQYRGYRLTSLLELDPEQARQAIYVVRDVYLE